MCQGTLKTQSSPSPPSPACAYTLEDFDSKSPAPASSPSSSSTDEGCSLPCTDQVLLGAASLEGQRKAAVKAESKRSKRQGQAGHPPLSPASGHHSSGPYPLLPGAGSFGCTASLGDRCWDMEVRRGCTHLGSAPERDCTAASSCLPRTFRPLKSHCKGG